jgi:hypothetical protein
VPLTHRDGPLTGTDPGKKNSQTSKAAALRPGPGRTGIDWNLASAANRRRCDDSASGSLSLTRRYRRPGVGRGKRHVAMGIREEACPGQGMMAPFRRIAAPALFPTPDSGLACQPPIKVAALLRAHGMRAACQSHWQWASWISSSGHRVAVPRHGASASSGLFHPTGAFSGSGCIRIIRSYI